MRSPLIVHHLSFVTNTLCLLPHHINVRTLKTSLNCLPSVHQRFFPRPSLQRLFSLSKDAGYSFEDYAIKRTSFEPILRAYREHSDMPWPNYYSNPSLKRSAKLHEDEAQYHAILRGPNSRFILVWRGRNVFRSQGDMFEAVKFEFTDCADLLNDPQSIVMYLGADFEIHYFAIDISHLSEMPMRKDYVIDQLRSMGGLIDNDNDAGTLALARGLSVWHRSEKYCSNCGSASLLPIKAGSAKICSSCKQQHYPRIDPSIIALITTCRGEYGLFGRKSIWPAGRYSLLAGFAEVGEALEETVVREVWEESGVHVRPESIRFCSSQTWPFPRSLMIGFIGEAQEAAGGNLPAIEIDAQEMEDVRWISREHVRNSLAGGGAKESGGVLEPFSIPGRAAIAHRLIMDWLGAPCP